MRINQWCRVSFKRRAVARDYGITFIDATGNGVHVGAVCRLRKQWLARHAERNIEAIANTREAATKELLYGTGYITEAEARTRSGA